MGERKSGGEKMKHLQHWIRSGGSKIARVDHLACVWGLRREGSTIRTCHSLGLSFRTIFTALLSVSSTFLLGLNRKQTRPRKSLHLGLLLQSQLQFTPIPLLRHVKCIAARRRQGACQEAAQEPFRNSRWNVLCTSEVSCFCPQMDYKTPEHTLVPSILGACEISLGVDMKLGDGDGLILSINKTLWIN